MSTNTAELILSASYIVKGFFEKVIRRKLRDTTKLQGGGGGEVEVVSWLTGFAHTVEDTWEEESPVDASGVWVYEVAEPFGRWVAEFVNVTGEFPDDEEASKKAREYALDLINK